MHFTVYVIPGPQASPAAQQIVATSLLEAFDQNREVEPWMLRITDAEIRQMAEVYDIVLPDPLSDLFAPVERPCRPRAVADGLAGRASIATREVHHPALMQIMRKVPDWLGGAGEVGLDDAGIYRTVSYNPDGKWDYFTPYDPSDVEWLAGATRGEAAQSFLVEPTTPVPYAIITPDGAWHEAGYAEMLLFSEDNAAWQRENERLRTVWSEQTAPALLASHRGCPAFAFDCHS